MTDRPAAPTNMNFAAAPTGAATTQDKVTLRRSDDEPTYRASRRVSPELAAEHFAAVAGDTDPELIDGKANETWRALGYRWARYARWCDATGRTPLPCDAHQALDYVRALLAERMAPSTVEVYVAAICTVARLRRSSADRSLIGEHMRAARRRHGPPRRARPTRGGLIADVFDLLDPEAIRDVRDGMVLALMFGLAGRAGELVGLDLERAGSVTMGSTGVVHQAPGELVVRWHRSKTAQTREVEMAIPDADMPEARLWLERWLARAAIAPGTPVVRPLTKHGTVIASRMSTAAVTRIVRARIEQLELARGTPPAMAVERARHFSSHSLRRGFCTTAAEAGVPLAVIRNRSRHSSDALVAQYVGDAEGRRTSGLEGLVPKGRRA